MDWIKIESLEDLPTSGNFLVCKDFDAIANVYWDQVPLSDGEDGNPRSMATIISQTKVRTYRQCIKIIEAEMY